MRRFVFVLLALLPAVVAEAQEGPIAVTGSLLTFGSASEPFTDDIEELRPWSIGVTATKRSSDSRTSIVIERFSLRENVHGTQNLPFTPFDVAMFSRGGVMRSDFLAFRAEKTWAVQIPNPWGLRPSLGGFAGMAFVTGRPMAAEYSYISFCEGEKCGDINVPPGMLGDLEPKPRKGTTGAYLGVIAEVARNLADNAEARLAFDAHGTFGRRLRANVSWWPKW